MISRVTAILCFSLCLAEGEEHWAYQPPVEVSVSSAGGHPIDVLLAAKRREAGVECAPLADPERWLERAAYTLTGLPPTQDQIDSLAAKPDEQTWRELIDELLASPAYGEHWARHWMDVARYSDTRGYNFDRDNRYPYAYTYRDWLIRAFNEDLPYDRFVKLQVAADLLVDREDHPDLAALGFLTVGPRGGNVETIDDRVDVITRGFLSTTVSCARCHEHKTDPITEEDYYSFYSILENTEEHQPVIGKVADEVAAAAFAGEKARLDEADHGVRQGMVEEMRSRDTLATYLELAWRARKEGWDHGQATAEGFRKGRYRPTAILRWRDFLDHFAWGGEAHPELKAWASEMESTEDKMVPSRKLADAWLAALATGGDLAGLANDGRCPLSYDANRIREIFDTQDNQESAKREAELARLEMEHPGAPPRAMAVRSRKHWAPAQVFRRGNPGEKQDPFPRQWLSALGGGAYPDDRDHRLVMAEKLADRANPLTARVLVNRVWAWHFGAPLANLGDFGPQEPAPRQQELLDRLAVWFMDHGWSVKELHGLLLTSQAFRLAAAGPERNLQVDEGNDLFWKWNRKRVDFEPMRDRLLLTAGALKTSLGGRSVDLLSSASDHRRSVYGFVDRHDLPGLLVNFDVPHPDHHAPKRLETTVPQQALYFLNNELPMRMARRLAADPEFRALPDDGSRVRWLYQRIYRRGPDREEVEAAVRWIREADPQVYEPILSGHWEVGFREGSDGELQRFPLFSGGMWKTGEDIATAPVPWLSAGAESGHTLRGYALVLQWRAHGKGKVRLKGRIHRHQKGGDTLAWEILGPGNKHVDGASFPAESASDLATDWIEMVEGDTLALSLTAPHGQNCGGVTWSLSVEELVDGEERRLGTLRDQFPTSNEPPTRPEAGGPWADLIQALWASNEFHFID